MYVRAIPTHAWPGRQRGGFAQYLVCCSPLPTFRSGRHTSLSCTWRRLSARARKHDAKSGFAISLLGGAPSLAFIMCRLSPCLILHLASCISAQSNPHRLYRNRNNARPTSARVFNLSRQATCVLLLTARYIQAAAVFVLLVSSAPTILTQRNPTRRYCRAPCVSKIRFRACILLH